MILVRLFWAFTKIGAFAIGGAYSFLPIIEKEIVQGYSWLTKEEFLDILGMARMLPGAISIKYATYTGYKIAGVAGAMAANIGNMLVPSFLVLFVFGLYMKYKDVARVRGAFNLIELVVFAMIIAVAFKLVNVSQLLHARNLSIVIICFVLFIYTRVHPALIIIAAGLLGAFLK